jgi:hypothetical protein
MEAAARKLQKAFRRKFVFSNASVPGVKFTPTKMTTQIVRFRRATSISKIFDAEPKGFSEIIGYAGTRKVAAVRWVPGRGWIGDESGVTRIAAKRQGQTIVITKDLIEVKGSGNYEPAVLAVVRNGLADKGLLRATPEVVKFEGRFNVNHTLALYGVAEFLESFGKVEPYEPELHKAVIFKTQGITFQIFKNGTILFGGLKDLSDLDKPRQIFKGLAADPQFKRVFYKRLTTLPTANANQKKIMQAGRYTLAGMDWNSALEKPPFGSYIRPGQDGKPRFYPWAKVTIQKHGVGNNAGPAQTFYTPLKLQKKDATAVAKAFAKVGQPIPAHTLEVFAKAGVPIPKYESPKPAYLLNRGEASAPSNKKKYKGVANRRANSWNATRAGFYVRPGPGKQPYFYEVPKGIAAGRKTVIKTYTEAGRNIPKAVREIFKIGANVTTESRKEHRITMGLNGILRINDRQATRLTKKELIEIARNMNIAQVEAKWKPEEIRAAIQNKAGIKGASKKFDVQVNGTKYKLLNNGRVEKTMGETRTQRNWATIPLAERNAIAKKLLPSNLHAEYNGMPNSNKFNTLRAFMASRKAPTPSPPKPAPKPKSPSPSPNVNNRFAMELEYDMLLNQNLGNLKRNGNQGLFMNIYNKLPKGARGKPLKANVNRAYAKFVKEAKALRVSEPARARYVARIAPPNWLPANKVNAYKKILTNLAFKKPKLSQKALKEALRAWLNKAAPAGNARGAYNVENINTGIITRVPAYNPANRKSPIIPKRTPSPKRSPKTAALIKAAKNAAKAAKALQFNTKKAFVIPRSENVENLGNAMLAVGLNVRSAHSWDAVVRSGVNSKFKNTWARYVVTRAS